MMNPYYQSLHKDVTDIHYRLNDAFDKRDHPVTNLIRQQAEHLKSDVASGKDLRSIDNRARGIQTRIMQAEHSGQGVMSTDSTNYFNQRIKHLSDNIRRHPHFN